MSSKSVLMGVLLVSASSAWATTTTPPPVPASTSVSSGAAEPASVSAPAPAPTITTSVTPDAASGPTNDTTTVKTSATQLQAELAAMQPQTPTNTTLPSWYRYVHLGGLMNINLSHWTKPNFGVGPYDQTQSTYIEVAPAVLTLDAEASPWASAHAAVIYMNGSSPSVRNYRPTKNVNRQINLDDAYITIGNFNRAPYYARVGEQFVPFGHYDLYPITQSLTQVLSEMDEPAVEGGFVSQSGLSGAIYALTGSKEAADHNNASNSINNFGVHVGYQNFSHSVGYAAGIGLLHNMTDVDAIRQIVDNNHGYAISVPGVSANAGLYFGPFGLTGDYVTATRQFGVNDYAWQNHQQTRGAKPSATGIDTSYKFDYKGHHSQVDVGYQFSNQAHNSATSVVSGSATQLPKFRWVTGLGMNVVKNSVGQLQFVREKDYPTSNGGTGRFNNIVTLQASLLF